MKPLDFETLRAAVEEPGPQSRQILFAGLAASRAGWRARSAEQLLKFASQDVAGHRALTRSFGQEVDAIFTSAMDELRALIGQPASEAWGAFAESARMDYEAWHDGTGFDLEALGRMPPIEQDLIRQWLHTRIGDGLRRAEPREIEAAAALGETELLTKLTEDSSADVRLQVKELLQKPDDVASELCQVFITSRSEEVVLRALDRVPAHATPEVRSALAKRVARVDGTFINSAMTLLEVFAGVADAWNERPLLFQIQSEGSQGPLLKQLLARVGRTRCPPGLEPDR